MSLDLHEAYRDALQERTAIASLLSEWKGEPAVFTRRPAPDDAQFPMAFVSFPDQVTDMDGLTAKRPIVRSQIAFYGNKGAPGSAQDDTRDVEAMAVEARTLFHRNRFAISPSGFTVVDIQVQGPMTAPVDDDSRVGRLIVVTTRLRNTT